MTAKIISLFNQKGGSGKSTASMHVAAGLADTRKKVLVVDMDPQGTSTQWASQGPEDKVFPARVINLSQMGGKMHREVQRYMDEYDYIVIDCPPRLDSMIVISMLAITDLVIIPVGASPADMWASKPARDLALQAKDQNESLEICYLASNIQNSAGLTGDVLETLGSDPDVRLLKSHLSQRVAFRECQLYGGSVLSLPGAKKAADEVRALVKEIKSILGGKR